METITIEAQPDGSYLILDGKGERLAMLMDHTTAMNLAAMVARRLNAEVVFREAGQTMQK